MALCWFWKLTYFLDLGSPPEADSQRKICVQILHLGEKQEALAESREWESDGKATKSHIFKQVSSVGSWGSFLLGGSRRPNRTCLGVVPFEGWEELGCLSSTSTSGWLRTAPGTLTPPSLLARFLTRLRESPEAESQEGCLLEDAVGGHILGRWILGRCEWGTDTLCLLLVGELCYL